MQKAKLVLVAILVLLVLTFVVQNSEVVTVTVLFWDFAMSRVILILLATAVGFSCGYLVARIGSARAGARG